MHRQEVSVVATLTKLRAFLDHKLHAWVSIAAIVYFLYEIVPVIEHAWANLHHRPTGSTPPIPEFSWHSLQFLGAVALSNLVKHASKVWVERLSSAPVSPPRDAVFDTDCFAINRVVRGPAAVEAVQLFCMAFPTNWYTDVPADRKRQAILNVWMRFCPQTILAIVDKDSNELIGISIAIRLKQGTFRQYRAGEIEPWDLTPDNFQGEVATGGPCYIFYQVLYARRRCEKIVSTILTGLAIAHVAIIAGDGVPVVVAPRKSQAGKNNAEDLGFEHIRENYKGLPLFELDLRKVDDLNDDAQDFRRRLVEFQQSDLYRQLRASNPATLTRTTNAWRSRVSLLGQLLHGLIRPTTLLSSKSASQRRTDPSERYTDTPCTDHLTPDQNSGANLPSDTAPPVK